MKQVTVLISERFYRAPVIDLAVWRQKLSRDPEANGMVVMETSSSSNSVRVGSSSERRDRRDQGGFRANFICGESEPLHHVCVMTGVVHTAFAERKTPSRAEWEAA